MGAEAPGTAVHHEFELASRLAAIIESSADAIIGKTLDGTITTWNAGAVHMYGYTASEIVGSNVSVLIPPDRIRELAPILDRLRQGERVEHFETKRLCKDGRIVDVSVSISPIRDSSGAVVGASTVARDMTERNLAEAERHAMAQERHHTERLRTLGQLAGGIAHDFNNLLFAILSFAGFVADESADRPAVRADAEQIQAAAHRAERLTRQLLVFSRRESAETEVLDLNIIIADMRRLLSTSIRSASIEADIELRVCPVAHLATIAGDRGQVEQVLLNLAVNARDAMPQGGTLTIGTRVTELDEEYASLHPGVSPGPYLELAVSDTGTGMSAEVAARIFEPFFTTKSAAKGTGLGLSAVYGIVTEAGGSMSVDSAEGAGTTFRLFFPAIGAPTAAAQADAPAAARGRGATILIVDDEQPVLEITSRILRRDGYAILEACSYEEAVSMASSHDFQLLLSDRVMPRVPGAALAERVAELRPGVRVLHMSGYAAGMLDPPSIGDGEPAFIQKPFTGQALLDKVHAVLDSPPTA
jgi:two-component system, cell cycle sensor histidine kinase and response regulator CckA